MPWQLIAEASSMAWSEYVYVIEGRCISFLLSCSDANVRTLFSVGTGLKTLSLVGNPKYWYSIDGSKWGSFFAGVSASILTFSPQCALCTQ